MINKIYICTCHLLMFHQGSTYSLLGTTASECVTVTSFLDSAQEKLHLMMAL